MQETLFPYLTSDPHAPYYDYDIDRRIDVLDVDVAVIIFAKQLSNGKNIYLVGERYKWPYDDIYETHSLLEYKHSRSRALICAAKRADEISRNWSQDERTTGAHQVVQEGA